MPPIIRQKKTGAAGAGRISGGHAAPEPGKIKVSLCGRQWTLLRPSDLESLWESMTDNAFAQDDRLPYWVELWPSSLALALWLQKRQDQLTGRQCLDLGCGLGFTALVGAWLGAKVLAVDYEKEALVYAAKNAAVNKTPAPCRAVMDWRRPAVAARSCDLIWGGDIMYERRFAMPILSFLDHALADSGLVWIAEPGRSIYNDFQRVLLSKKWRSRCVCQENVEPAGQKVPVSVRIWEISRN